jgi:adenylate cyclase
VSDAITVSEMRAPLRKRVRLIDRLAVKGNSAELEIMELGWRRRVGAPFTTEQGTLLEQRKAVCITLFFAGLEIAIDASRVPFTIGRDASNDLSVASRKASREHARIEWRRNKFVLFDHSTNGTYVTLAGAPEVIVKHESFLLRGHGTFSLGEAVRPKAPGVIGFECR